MTSKLSPTNIDSIGDAEHWVASQIFAHRSLLGKKVHHVRHPLTRQIYSQIVINTPAFALHHMLLYMSWVKFIWLLNYIAKEVGQISPSTATLLFLTKLFRLEWFKYNFQRGPHSESKLKYLKMYIDNLSATHIYICSLKHFSICRISSLLSLIWKESWLKCNVAS